MNVSVKALNGTVYAITGVNVVLNVREKLTDFLEFKEVWPSQMTLFRDGSPLADTDHCVNGEDLFLFVHCHPLIRFIENMKNRRVIEIEFSRDENNKKGILMVQGIPFAIPMTILRDYLGEQENVVSCYEKNASLNSSFSSKGYFNMLSRISHEFIFVVENEEEKEKSDIDDDDDYNYYGCEERYDNYETSDENDDRDEYDE